MSITQRALSVFGQGLVAIGALTAVLAAAHEQLPGVFIDTKDVTSGELAEVKRLAGSTGRDPWLIYGFRHGLGAPSAVRHTTFEVYLQPDVENGALRRGRMLRVEEPAPPGVGQQREWRLESAAKYAQVADGARLPDTPIGRWNRLRPFLVDGEFDDQTLLNLVALVRSNAPGPHFGTGIVPDRVDGSLVMSNVRRTGTSIEVRLTANDGWNGQEVTLEERNGTLVVVKIGLWIV